MTIDLDDSAALAQSDPGGMIGMIAGLPAQLGRAAEAQRALQAATPAVRPASVRDVLVCGMGGSAIGGDVAAAWAETHGLRISVHRGYGLPRWLQNDCLLVFSSYSGNTEETLSAFAASEAVATPRLALATGGALAARAEAAGVPIYPLPAGLQPRAALGHSLTGVLLLLHAAGLVPDPVPELDAAARHLEWIAARCAPASPEAKNPAKALARRFQGRLPAIYTGPGLLAPAGVRWKGQINENAKCLALASVFPELDHNEIMGWQALPAELRGRAALAVLRDRDDGEAVHRRMQATCDILEPRVASIDWIDAEGQAPLDRLLGTIYLGDWTSLYLAFLAEVDPTPVAEIELLKKRLAEAARR